MPPTSRAEREEGEIIDVEESTDNRKDLEKRSYAAHHVPSSHSRSSRQSRHHRKRPRSLSRSSRRRDEGRSRREDRERDLKKKRGSEGGGKTSPQISVPLTPAQETFSAAT